MIAPLEDYSAVPAARFSVLFTAAAGQGMSLVSDVLVETAQLLGLSVSRDDDTRSSELACSVQVGCVDGRQGCDYLLAATAESGLRWVRRLEPVTVALLPRNDAGFETDDPRVVWIDSAAGTLAGQIQLLGALCVRLGWPSAVCEQALREHLPRRLVDGAIEVFREGRATEQQPARRSRQLSGYTQ